MADYQDRMADYVDVAERIRIFRELYPTGSLQPANPANPYDIVTVDGKVFVVYVAAAYRSPDDPLPGIGTAWEPFPGTTPYTRNSELMVAETSAWGRAIVASLAADTKKVASLDEARNRRTQEQHPAATNTPEAPQRLIQPSNSGPAVPASPGQLGAIRAISKSMGKTPPAGYEQLSKREAMAVIDALKAQQAQEAPVSDEEPF